MKAVVNYEELIRLMSEGILMEDGTVRDFDIIDFYQNCNMSIENFYDRYVEKYGKKDILTLRRFVRKYVGEFLVRGYYPSETKKFDEWSIKELIDTVDLIKNPEFDENGDYIIGSGRHITDEEKVEAYEYMKSFGHHVTYKMVNCALDRIANGIPFEAPEKSNVLNFLKK